MMSSDTDDGIFCRWVVTETRSWAKICDLHFQTTDHLVSHLNNKHLNTYGNHKCFWLGCSKYGKLFSSRTSIIVHTRSHTGEKPYQCTICGKQFTQNVLRKQHEIIHSGLIPYPCTLSGCGKRFIYKSNRNRHEKTHLRERPYRCEKSYSHKHHLKLRIENVYSVESGDECGIISKDHDVQHGCFEHSACDISVCDESYRKDSSIKKTQNATGEQSLIVEKYSKTSEFEITGDNLIKRQEEMCKNPTIILLESNAYKPRDDTTAEVSNISSRENSILKIMLSKESCLENTYKKSDGISLPVGKDFEITGDNLIKSQEEICKNPTIILLESNACKPRDDTTAEVSNISGRENSILKIRLSKESSIENTYKVRDGKSLPVEKDFEITGDNLIKSQEEICKNPTIRLLESNACKPANETTAKKYQ